MNATPFKRWCLQHYGVDIGRKKEAAAKRETMKEELPQMQQHVPQFSGGGIGGGSGGVKTHF